MYIFGSLVGDAPWHSRSDVDLAVEGLPPELYFAALSTLYDAVPEGVEVDLVTLEDAPATLVSRIKGGFRMPEDSKEALGVQVADEPKNLERLVTEARELLAQRTTHPTSIEVRAAGSLLHDFYTAVERIFERVTVRFGPGLPVGEGWHAELLRSMEAAVKQVRPSVIDHQLAQRLAECLRFRHVFRYSFGYDLQWPKMRPLLKAWKIRCGS